MESEVGAWHGQLSFCFGLFPTCYEEHMCKLGRKGKGIKKRNQVVPSPRHLARPHEQLVMWEEEQMKYLESEFKCHSIIF